MVKSTVLIINIIEIPNKQVPNLPFRYFLITYSGINELLESKLGFINLGKESVSSKSNHHVPTPVLIGKIAIVKPKMLLKIYNR